MKKIEIRKSMILTIVDNHGGLYEGNLRHYFRLIFQAPNRRNPYHNFRHTIHVFCQVYLGGKFEKLNKTNMRALLIAALFHDYGHSGKMGNDKAEIAKAIMALEEHILDEDRLKLPKIKELIRMTEWPHDYLGDESEAIKILRDADLSQVLDDVWWQQIIFGLSEEFGETEVNMLRKQINFLSGLSFHSAWGKKTYQPKISSRIIELNEFLDILLGE